MKTQGHCLSQLFDAKFPGKLDDTLVNRLCRSIVCQNKHHLEFWSRLSACEWDLISKHATRWNSSYEYTVELHVILKVAVSLSFRYGLLIGNEEEGPHNIILYALNLSDKRVKIILIEALAGCLEGIVSLDDLRVVLWIFTPTFMSVLHTLCDETNVHVFKNIVTVCAYVFLHILLNNKAWVDQQPFNECFKLSHFGTEVLFLMGQLIHKFGVYFDPLTIPFEFQFSTNTYNSFSSEVQVKLLYLAFTNVISTPSSNGEWISFLKSLENFPELCASVINLCFKSKRTLCPELWDFIVKEWATALQSRFENGMSDSILCVITPVCQYSEAILHLDAGSNLLEKIISTVTNFHYSLKGSCVQKCRTRLWILSRILIRCSPCLITKLPDIIGVVDFLISVCTAPYIESVTFEVNAAFNFFKEFCLLYWDSEKSLTINLITKFLDSLLTCQNSRVFSTFLLPLLQSLQKLSTKYGCLEVYCTFWTFLFKILSKAQSEFINQSVVSSCIHNEGLLETVITVLKLLSCEVYISLWTSECRLLFLNFVNNAISELGIGNFISDVCLRGLILSAFIIFMVSEYHDNCTHLESKDVQKFHEWTWNSYNYLIDFDVMEITESKCICEILWNKIKYLEEESEKCSNDLWKRIVVSLKTKWDTNLGEHYLLSIQESSNQYCPNCKENIDELLDDIMISSTSNMIADCTEG